MLTPAARSGLVIQTFFAIGISPIIVFLTALYVTGKPEPDWRRALQGIEIVGC
jgi:hypothetical protein